MRVLITGGAGYIGTTLTQLLLDQGFAVRVLDSLLFGINPLLPCFRHPAFEFVQADIRDAADVQGAATQDIDIIVHLAAIVGYPACDKDVRLAHEVNVEGTKIIDFYRRMEGIPIIYASTGSVYGKLETLCDEDSTPNPLTTYGRTKLLAEQLLLKSSDNTLVYRFATAFGLSPRLRLDLLVNDFTYQAVHNHYLVVYESHFRRTFLHVSDIASAILHGIKSFKRMKGGVYNVGSNALNATKKDIADLISRHVTFNLHFSENGHDADQRDYEVDYSRLSATGFTPQVSLETGIEEMVRAFKYLRVPNPYSNVGV